MDIGSWVLQKFKGVNEDVVVCLANDGRCVLRLRGETGGYHIGVDVGLPVERSLGLEVLGRSVELEEARLRDEDTSVPFLEDLLGSDSLEHHSAEEVVHDEERGKRRHSSRSSLGDSSYCKSSTVSVVVVTALSEVLS